MADEPIHEPDETVEGTLLEVLSALRTVYRAFGPAEGQADRRRADALHTLYETNLLIKRTLEVRAQPVGVECRAALALVGEMRRAQREYFRNRSSAVLAESKSLEAQVDRLCRESLEPPTLTGLRWGDDGCE